MITSLDCCKVKELADESFKLYEIKGTFSKRVDNTVEKEKLLVTSNFSFSRCVFKRLLLQTPKNHGLFGKGLIHDHKVSLFQTERACRRQF